MSKRGRVWWEVHHPPTHNMIGDFVTLREARELASQHPSLIILRVEWRKEGGELIREVSK